MPNFEIVMVQKQHQDGKIDGVWVQGACGCTLEEASERLRKYADSGKGVTFALIEGYGAYISPGQTFQNFQPKCPPMWNEEFPQRFTP